MRNALILDCTLRDGGYINDFDFGKPVIRDVIEKLSKANVEIIECGFLKSGQNDSDKTLFASVEAVRDVIKQKRTGCIYVAMIQYGAISAEEITAYDGSSIDGIRVTFHEHEIDGAFSVGKALMEKGYKVFMQPVGTVTYTDIALLQLVERINVMEPYAFYLVDTLGTMYKNNLLRMFYLIDNNLNPDILIGFHPHNNLQLSFSNAQELLLLNSPRKIIIDSSAYGMGRGAGNLCTELLMNYINENIAKLYDLSYILEIIDSYILPIYAKTPWGYAIPYYIASIYNCHPDYASYLINKQTLTITNINRLIELIPPLKKALFHKDCIKQIYYDFSNHYIDDSQTLQTLDKLFRSKNVLLIAPGNSVSVQEKDILEYIDAKNPIVVAINSVNPNITADYIFVSNRKRFQMLQDNAVTSDIIKTSNISEEYGENTYYTVNYFDYLVNIEEVSDNAGIMAMNLLEKLKVKGLVLAGFDGFNGYGVKDYYSNRMMVSPDLSKIEKMNFYITEHIKALSERIPVKFVTKSNYDA